MKMSTIGNYPTQHELDKFYDMCKEVELVVYANRVFGHGDLAHVTSNRTYTGLLNDIKHFLLKLKYINLGPMLKHVVEKNQTELIELINRISPTIETFPTDDENHRFNRLCEALHQESIRPVDDSTHTRKIIARKNMNIFWITFRLQTCYI